MKYSYTCNLFTCVIPLIQDCKIVVSFNKKLSLFSNRKIIILVLSLNERKIQNNYTLLLVNTAELRCKPVMLDQRHMTHCGSASIITVKTGLVPLNCFLCKKKQPEISSMVREEATDQMDLQLYV